MKKTPRFNQRVTLHGEELARLGIRVTPMFLYGSCARDARHEGSNINLIVVSPDFTRFKLRERLDLLRTAAARVLEPVQACGLTPDEIERNSLSPFSWPTFYDMRQCRYTDSILLLPSEATSTDSDHLWEMAR